MGDEEYQPLKKEIRTVVILGGRRVWEPDWVYGDGLVGPRATHQGSPSLSFLKPLHLHCSCWIRSCACGARTFLLPVTLQESSQPFCLAVKVSPAPVRQPSCPFLANNGQHLPPPWHQELHSRWLKFHALYPVFTMSSSS